MTSKPGGRFTGLLCVWNHWRLTRRYKKVRRKIVNAARADTSRRAKVILALGSALDSLAEIAPTQARGAELRFFSGLSIDDMANLLDIARRSVLGDHAVAKARLYHRLSKSGDQPAPR